MHVPPDHPPIDFLFGINPVFEAIRARRRKIRRAFLNQAQEKHPRLAKLAELIQKAGIELPAYARSNPSRAIRWS